MKPQTIQTEAKKQKIKQSKPKPYLCKQIWKRKRKGLMPNTVLVSTYMKSIQSISCGYVLTNQYANQTVCKKLM